MVNVWPNTGFESSIDPWENWAGSDIPTLTDAQVFLGVSSLYCRRGAGTDPIYAVCPMRPNLTEYGAGDYEVSVRTYIPATVAGTAGLEINGTGVEQTVITIAERDQWVRSVATFTWDGVGTVILYATGADANAECYIDQLRVDDGTTIEPVAPTAEAEVQSVDPPRVQITVTGLAGLGANLVDPNPSFETGLEGWTTAPADTQIVVPSNWQPPDEDPDADPPPEPADGNAYAHSLTGGAFSRDVPLATMNEIAASIEVLGPEDTLVTFTLMPLIDGQEDPDASGAMDQVIPDPTAWQSMDLTMLTAPEHTAVRFTVESTGEVALDNASLSSAVLPDTVTLFRVEEESGNRIPVRGFYEVPAQNSLIATDYGAPVNEPIHYEVVGYSDAGPRTLAVSNTITIPATTPWLTNPITGDGVSATIRSWTSQTYSARQAVVPIAGRAGPIVVSDRRLLASSELVLLTRTRAQLMQLRDILADGDVLQIRPPCEAVEHQYIAIGDVTETRIREDGPDAGSDWGREVTLTCQQVDQPSPNIPAVGDTLLDLHNYAPGTLLDLSEIAGPTTTWLDVATANLSPSVMSAGV